MTTRNTNKLTPLTRTPPMQLSYTSATKGRSPRLQQARPFDGAQGILSSACNNPNLSVDSHIAME